MRRALAALALALGPGLVVVAAVLAQQSAETQLVVEVIRQPGGAPERHTLTCGPAGGTLPGAADACGRLAAGTDPFRPVPADAACTMMIGGPEVATVGGVHRGQRVDASFHRRNGCENARYQGLMRALGLP